MELRSDRVERFAKIYWQSREDALQTQSYMANKLGVTRKTISNWERGVSFPSFSQTMEWFRALGLNPMPYYFRYLYPELIQGLGSGADRPSMDKAFAIVSDILPPTMLRQFYFLFYGDHDVDLKALSELMAMHLHLNMKDRVYAAQSITFYYRVAAARKLLDAADAIPPAIDYLERAVNSGMAAVINSRIGYTNVASQHYADIFKDSRTHAGKSQDFMAMNLGINRRTVKNWEDGAVEPSLFQVTEWFRVLELDILKYFFEMIYPSFEEEYPCCEDIFENIDENTRRKFLFMIFGSHGSSPISVLEMAVAFVHLPLMFRTNIAEITYRAYLMSEGEGDLICTHLCPPDKEYLHAVLEERKRVLFAGE